MGTVWLYILLAITLTESQKTPCLGGDVSCVCQSKKGRTTRTLAICTQSAKQLMTIPELADLVTMDRLHLRLKTMWIDKIQDYAFANTSLYSLYICCSKLGSIDGRAFAGVASTLRVLKLPDNKLKYISSQTFEGLQQLEVLDISRNRLRKLSSLCQVTLPLLQRLSLKDNRLSSAGNHCFGGMSSLRILDLSKNKIKKLMSLFLSGVQQTLVILDLSENQITTIPRRLFHGMSSLKELRLSSNRLMTIDSLCRLHMPRLYSLKLSDNQIAAIPQNCWRMADGNAALPRLALLSITKNYLQDISSVCSAGFHSIRSLVLGGNEIRQLPADCFANMSQLRYLNLRGNSIADFYTTHGLERTRLVYLDISHNYITSLPPNVTKHLPALKHLSVTGNKLRNYESHCKTGSSMVFDFGSTGAAVVYPCQK